MKKKISNLQPGMIVGEDIYNLKNRLSLKKGQKLDKNTIDLLLHSDITEIEIEETTSSTGFIQKTFEELPNIVDEVIYNKWINSINDLFHNFKKEETYISLNNITEEIYKALDIKEYFVLNFINSFGNDSLNYHSLNTAIIVSIIAKKIEIPYVMYKQTVKFALIHDIGYAMLDERIINDFESDERNALIHNIVAYKKLQDLKATLNHEILESILYHHERYDGKGKFHLKGEKVPPLVRITQVADAYTSLTELGYTPYQALSWILKKCGFIFDPYYVGLLYEITGYYPTGTKVKLSDGSIGTVLKRNEIEFFPEVLINNQPVKTGPDTDIYIKEVIE
ncbi:HD-GYP domain, c-di-GMP phosphodiesterase class II (or its inactivated variant) [Marinitoga hydrogenitolerans DSM 16785]|uniref:HD-GYP domain, c-di-GMP phosphodiesterase class II (Or its inactivated variant) n=1 Tax=Marinitoga hydrogenitolerans (strain DSM 16785 / JCM 12826 / AT1271) TaxID=1122195 RepID=A0A1M4Y6N6_MARH1|nr:HD domain-containing protein [Marinitoga hydrogenitolerans]SHF01122.1 HD-GYP domain, c-di-GMP phosphodiesterase class II (or its inactivated variant) [Marinitoga hydrogenitolerans DSM 16785]